MSGDRTLRPRQAAGGSASTASTAPIVETWTKKRKSTRLPKGWYRAKVVKHQKIDATDQYLVHWTGYRRNADQWVPEKDVTASAIEAYFAPKKKKKKKKKKPSGRVPRENAVPGGETDTRSRGSGSGSEPRDLRARAFARARARGPHKFRAAARRH